jgi:hypothetical protein
MDVVMVEVVDEEGLLPLLLLLFCGSGGGGGVGNGSGSDGGNAVVFITHRKTCC